MTDENALVCSNPACEHRDDQHDERTGLCMVPSCRCVCFRMEWEDEDEDEFEPLDFDDDDAA